MESLSLLTGKVSLKKVTFTWCIENFLDIDADKDELVSPMFDYCGLKWKILCYPKGEQGISEGHVSLGLQLIDSSEKFSTNLKFSIVNSDKVKCNSRIGGIREFSEIIDTWSFNQFIKRDELVNDAKSYLPGGHLTVMCEIFPDHYDVYSEVAMNFSHLLHTDKCSDVKFIIGGENVSAHKIILANKSKVFAELFEKTETGDVVEIEDIELSVFLEMLRFIYTGKVENIKNIANDLVVVADKYALADLKDICSDFLSSNLSEKNAIDSLKFAIAHDVTLLKTKSIDFIVANARFMKEMPEFKSIMELEKDMVFEIICTMAAEME